MALSQDLINQFVKVTNYQSEQKKTTYNATFKIVDGLRYVQIDGSNILTPVTQTVVAEDGDRVVVSLENHTAVVNGNVTSPAASSSTVNGILGNLEEFGNEIELINSTLIIHDSSIIALDSSIKMAEADILIAKSQLDIQDTMLQIHDSTIKEHGDTIHSINNNISIVENRIDMTNSNLESLNDTVISQGNIIFQQGNTIVEQGTKIDAQGSNIKAVQSDMEIVNSAFTITDGVLEGLSEIIVDKLTTDYLNAKYADIDFANIGDLQVKNFFAKTGMIENLVVSDQHVTGRLVGVTIIGDIIEGNTIKAEKLVVKGKDGLYYSLNLNAEKVEAEQTDYNSINGSIITAKSITAEKILVDDLSAFKATIGGFKLTEDSIYSGVKESVNNMTRGLYMDNDGQMAFGDGDNYVKYYFDSETKSYKMIIAAGSIILGAGKNNLGDQIGNIETNLKKSIKDVDVYYALSSSSTVPPKDGWNTIAPQWEANKYMWQKTVITYNDDTTSESDPTCIQGAKGENGQNGGNGTSSYTHIRYSKNADGSNMSTNPTDAIYIGIYTGVSSTAPSTPSSYTWSKFKGDNGEKGATGKDGNGINSITYYYKVTTNQTVPAASSITSTTIPALSSTDKYLWQKEVIDFTDSSIADKTSVSLIAVYGDKGDKGTNGTSISITSTSIQYAASSDGLNKPSSGWSTKIPTVNNGQYLWTETVVNYSDGTKTTSYSVAYKGTNGAKGDTGEKGTSVTSIVEEYYLSTSETELAGGTWENKCPKWMEGFYIWTRSKITYSNPVSTSYTTPVCSSEWATLNSMEADIDSKASNADLIDLNNAIMEINSNLGYFVVATTDENGETILKQDGSRMVI